MSSQSAPVRRSRRHVTAIIPASHWISIGYSQGQANAMVKLQHDIKKYYDGYSDETIIKLEGRPDGILPHHDMMLPHWQKLGKALHGRTSINSLSIEFYNIHLAPPVLDIMFPALQSMDLYNITLNRNDLGYDEYMLLSSYIKENSSLKYLTVEDNDIDLSIAPSLSDAIKDHPTLERVSFVNSGLNNAAVLEKVLAGCKTLSVAIQRETFQHDAIAILVDFIRSNHRTRSIWLNNNNLSDGDMFLFALALNNNTNLSSLNLRDNYIGGKGDKTLLNAMYNPTSMDSIIESNHTCGAYTYNIINLKTINKRRRSEREAFNINNMNVSIQQKIRRKVVLALCGFEGELFDLSHLNDLPLQLMPRVLELIQEHTEARTREVKRTPLQLEKDALSRLFHTLRGWELPLLFGNLRGPSSEGGGKKRKRRKTRR